MSQATTFGRRGVATGPVAPVRPQNQPPARPPPPTSAPRPRKTAIQLKDESVAGYFFWLLFSFSGRLSRTTYRYCRIIANLLFLFTLYGVMSVMMRNKGDLGVVATLGLFSLCLSWLWMWTTLAMQVKRRHDMDKSWPWLFTGFIPIIGPLWVLIETCWIDGTSGYNRFDEPSDVAAATF